MRITEFRGMTVDRKIFIYGDLIHCETGKYYIFPKGNYAGESDKYGEEGLLHLVAFEVIPETIGQYTGTWDKNGKKIYEGHILEFEDLTAFSEGCEDVVDSINRAAVVFEDGRFTLDKYCHDDLPSATKGSKVIGNVYENADLLIAKKSGR